MALPSNASLPDSGNLVMRWLLDEASGTRSDNVGSEDLTDNNTVTVQTGINELGASSVNAAKFIRVNSEYLSVADSTTSSITGDMTVSCWLNPATDPATDTAFTILSKYTSTGNQRGYMFGYYNLSSAYGPYFIVSDDGSATTAHHFTGNQLSTSTWTHLVWVYDASAGTIDCYIDDVAQTQGTSMKTSIFDNTSDLNIGRWNNLGEYANAGIQDVAVWSSVLSSAQVTTLNELYTVAPATGIPGGLTLLGVGNG